jgi:hypothetical protein
LNYMNDTRTSPSSQVNGGGDVKVEEAVLLAVSAGMAVLADCFTKQAPAAGAWHLIWRPIVRYSLNPRRME